MCHKNMTTKLTEKFQRIATKNVCSEGSTNVSVDSQNRMIVHFWKKKSESIRFEIPKGNAVFF